MSIFTAQLIKKYKKELSLSGWEILIEIYPNIETKTTHKDKIALICINKTEAEPMNKLAEIILREMKSLTTII